MDALFLSVLDRSLSASLVVAVVVVLRLLLKRAPKWLRCGLWILVAFRLLCPVSIESTFSLMPEQEVMQAETGEIAALYSRPAGSPQEQAKQDVYYEAPASNGTPRIVVPVAVADTPEIHWPGIGSVVWLAGMGLFLVYGAVSYGRLRKRVAASIELGNGVYLCDYIDSPFILGMVKPKIYLPSEMDPRDAAHVLAHERAHLKRKDHWWKPLGFGLLALYWFNPVMWLAYILLCRDIELACDEHVVKGMSLTDKKEYSEALLKCSVPRHMVVACPLAFGEVGVKERVRSVLRYQKPAFWVVLIAVVVCLITAVCFLTDPIQAEETVEDVSFDTSAVADLEELRGFDWESVEKYMDAGSYTLFDPLVYGERLFIGCQDGEDYYILCFQKDPAGSYEWEQVLYPHFPPNVYHNYPELLTAYCETENSELGLYVITDETITGIETYVGIWNYYRIDHWPALVLLNKADWSLNDYNFDVCYGSPAKIAFTLGENGDTLIFRETEVESPDCQYLYYSDAFFDDGFHMPGSYGLEEHELTQLVSLLTQLPEDALVPCGEPSAELHPVELYVGLDNGRLMDTRDTLLTFQYREDSVILGISERYSKGESYYTSDSPILYFQCSDQPLCDFILSLCDNSRKESSLIVYNESRFIEYSHADISIQLNSIQGWEYEIVEYTDENTPFGIRARLKGSDAGWVFYSCWPGGFNIGDGYASVSFNSSYGAFLRWYSEEEMEVPIQDRIWAYDVFTDIPGNYVRVNEGADEATLKYCPWLECEFGVAYTQCDDPSTGPHRTSFGTNENNKGYFQTISSWMSSIWDNDNIDYSHLFRFWPVGQTEGFISFTFMEGGFTPEDGLSVEEIPLSEPIRPFPAFTATEAGAKHWRYLWIDVDGGSYLLRNDNADHWTYKQWLQVMEMINNIVIAQYDVPE